MSDRPVDVLSEPLTAEEVEDVRIRGSNLALVDPRFYSLWDVINRLLATLDAARSATPSSEEADPGALADLIERWHVWNATTDDDLKVMLGLRLMQDAFDALPTLVTPDNAGRSSIDAATLERAMADVGAYRRVEHPDGDYTMVPRTTGEFARLIAARLSESTGSEEGA